MSKRDTYEAKFEQILLPITEKIGVQRVKNFLKAFLHAGANTVDIP